MSEMLQPKACARCGGDVRSVRDVYGLRLNCIQCGRGIDIGASAPLDPRYAQLEKVMQGEFTK